MTHIRAARIPALVGGAYGMGLHTRLQRETKDLDLFVHPRDCPRMLQLFSDLGYPSRLVARHWLGKVSIDGAVIDIIFGFRNGVGTVDDGWFDHAVPHRLFDTPIDLLAVEEMIWSKAFVMERDRYDGADISHLLRVKAAEIDWPRLLRRFGPYWLVLLNHLVMFSFIYPVESQLVPEELIRELLERWKNREAPSAIPDPPLCRGPLLSFTQYVDDVNAMGYADPRLPPIGSLTQENLAE